MRLSDDGLKVLILREGKSNKAYLDTKGIPTIGVGHTGGVKMGDVISDEEVENLLRKDCILCENTVNTYVKVLLTQAQFDALVSFIFNVGVNAFKKSTLLKVLNLGNYTEAAKQFDRWHIPPEIVGRRTSEKLQFLQA